MTLKFEENPPVNYPAFPKLAFSFMDCSTHNCTDEDGDDYELIRAYANKALNPN